MKKKIEETIEQHAYYTGIAQTILNGSDFPATAQNIYKLRYQIARENVEQFLKVHNFNDYWRISADDVLCNLLDYIAEREQEEDD